MRFLDLLFPPRSDELLVRDVPDEAFLALVSPTLVSVTDPETVALLPYHAAPVRSAVHEMKYHGNGRSYELLARALGDYLIDTEEGFGNPLLVPIPLGKARRRQRGFNQIEEVVRRVAEAYGLAWDAHLLERTRETISQVSLPKEKRSENMRGAFRATRPLDAARVYLLIDDVVTTGATLQAATDALTSAGAAHITPIALSH